jgi:hypothetical protein
MPLTACSGCRDDALLISDDEVGIVEPLQTLDFLFAQDCRCIGKGIARQKHRLGTFGISSLTKGVEMPDDLSWYAALLCSRACMVGEFDLGQLHLSDETRYTSISFSCKRENDINE